MKPFEVVPVSYPFGGVWYAQLAKLPSGPELERLARQTEALRRKRGVGGALELLRVVLSYGYCGLSFACASHWAGVNGAAKLSKAAVLRRVRQSQRFLEGLLATMLSKCLPGPTVVGMRVRLVDATRVPFPGNKGRCWRVHAVYAPFERCLTQLTITDHKGGERLDRVVLEPNDLIIGDRAYGGRRGVAHVVAAQAHFIVRTTWNHLPLESRDGGAFDLFEALRGLPKDGSGEF